MSNVSDISVVRRVEAFLQASKKPLIVVLGPTANGKTEFSIRLAHHLEKGIGTLPPKRVEIANADSRQFYRGLDIGTAKITEDEMEGIPHHLINVLGPSERATIAWYQKEATRVIRDIHKRGVVPMLVGGSMLYISAIIDGLRPLPSDPVIRKRLEAQYDQDDGRTLRERLASLDPDSASSIPRENKVYLVRALEIAEMSKRPASLQKHRGSSPFDLLIIGIQRPRSEIVQRINDRIDEMFARGWINEVRSLLEKGYRETDPGFESHGYREIAQFLKENPNCHTEPCRSATIRCVSWFDPSPSSGQATHHDMLTDFFHLKETIARKSAQYAKRQMTWWRGDSRIRWTSQ
ncbi:tRNA (adenosine(37)-N6)-dimethylallyltransferase MiaA [Candidatus Peregrinibacteria bacterium]|nr:tRNA (adenosine(37)-N6)-dimethylallyltransferase MiaA [Candidatus Peregrinibacteria bacterium]MBI3816376.1 tRNA (adenosine(37)-N6)-dimethylallyltransferase MiaA [Candidatus Peregrinibacteria bacterium]